MRRWLFDRGGFVVIAAFAAYATLASAQVVDGDNAEFSTLSVTGGIAHPSGYPLFLLWLRAWSWLPGSPAHAAALATGILGAAMIAVLHAACRAWGARPVSASFACAIFAGSPIVLRLATEAEVFVPNALLVSAVMWLCARGGPLRGERRAAALGLVAGLALANHLTCIFIAPVGILGVVRGVRESRARAVALAAAGLAVGLLPYTYALVAADTPASWGMVRGFDALLGHFTRRDYGVGQLVAHGDTAPLTASLGALLSTVARAWLYLPVFAAAIALALRAGWPSEAGETRTAWAMLALSCLLAGPLFVSRFDAFPEGIGLYIVQRFHLLPALLLAIPIAAAFDIARIPARIAPAAPMVFAAVALLSAPRVAAVHTRALEAFAHNTLHAMPERAVVVVGTDAFYFAMIYRQQLGDRPDVTVVAWPLMSHQWYRDRMAARDVVGEPGDGPPIALLARHVLRDRALFFEPGEFRDAFHSYPLGPFARVVAGAIPPLDTVIAENRALYASYDLDYARPGPDDEWATLVHQRYAAPWRAIASVVEQEGDDAGELRRLAAALEPLP